MLGSPPEAKLPIPGTDERPGTDGMDGRLGRLETSGKLPICGRETKLLIPGREGIDGRLPMPGREGIDDKLPRPGRDGILLAPGRESISGRDPRLLSRLIILGIDKPEVKGLSPEITLRRGIGSKFDIKPVSEEESITGFPPRRLRIERSPRPSSLAKSLLESKAPLFESASSLSVRPPTTGSGWRVVARL